MHRRAGFTLIELLIVIVILGLLAAIATSFFWDAKDRALERSMGGDLRNLAAQQELYYASAMTYASNTGDIADFTMSPGVSIAINYAEADGWAAQATHISYAGHACGIIIGNAPVGDGAPATEAGVVTCD